LLQFALPHGSSCQWDLRRNFLDAGSVKVARCPIVEGAFTVKINPSLVATGRRNRHASIENVSRLVAAMTPAC